MASNAVAATISKARSMAASPATANVPVTLASIATAAGYPGNRASSVRALARANGNGARANGQGRYTSNTPAGWVALLTGAQAALQPTATKQVQAKQHTAKVRQGWLGKQAAAAKQGARQAKATRKATAPQPTAAPPAQAAQGTPQGTPSS